MTKEELGNQIMETGQTLEEILPMSDGQECLIYKASEFSVSDEIIYIPDIYLNELAVINRRDGDDAESYAKRVVDNCYTGQDFVDECDGDLELAKRLFYSCDWQHPSSALPELDERDEDEEALSAPVPQTEGAVTDFEKRRWQLIDRMRENYSEYRAELLLKDRQELIDGAGRIAKTAEVFQYFTEQRITEAEVEHFLKFQNPLEVAANHWADCDYGLNAIDAVMAEAIDTEDDLSDYPLVTDAPVEKPSGLQKFMDVDVDRVFRQILAQKTAFYQKDLTYTLDTLREGAATDDPAKRNFVVIFRQSGVECLNERDMFIAGTQSYNTCQYYDKHTSEQVLAYSVELLGDGLHGLWANLYQQDQHQMARFAERAASPYTDVTITFRDGREVRIPEKEYNYQTVSNLKYHHGDVMDTRNEADDESVVRGALKRAHERRERMPKGHIAVHVQELEESRIQTEADRLASALQSLTEPNAPDKTHFMAQVSPYFLPLVFQDDMNRLYQKVREQVKQPLYFDKVDGKEGLYFFMRREERTQEQTHKPSIKEQLAAKPVPSDRPTKPKGKEVR